MAVLLEESTKNDIREWSHELLVKSRCINVFPTPAEKLASFINLKVSPEDLSLITPIYLDQDVTVLKTLIGQIRGLLLREQKTYISRPIL